MHIHGGLRLLEMEEMYQIHEAAMSLIADPGVQVAHEGALQILESRGIPVDHRTQRVRFPRELVEETIEKS